MSCPDDGRTSKGIEISSMDDYQKQQAESRTFSEENYPLQPLTRQVIAASFFVFRTFGYGFLESVYRRALVVELQFQGVPVAEEVSYELFHRGVYVGLYRADVVADSKVMVETKTGLVLDPIAPAQLLNCLSAAGLAIGLVIHFGPSGVQVKRVIASNGRYKRVR
jgi:GxxExxY protein